MKNLNELQLKELLDLVDTEACDLAGEHPAKTEILRRFGELETELRCTKRELRDSRAELAAEEES